MPRALCLPWELAACWLSLLLVGLLLEQSLGGLLGGGALLFLWRLLPRPVLLALLLPVNLPLAGLFTPVVDGLLVAWACAWTGVSLGLWGCLAAALAPGDCPLAPGQVEVGPGDAPRLAAAVSGVSKSIQDAKARRPQETGDGAFLWVLPRDAPHFFHGGAGIFYYTFVPKSGIIKPREYRGNAAESPILPGITAEEAPPGGQRKVAKNVSTRGLCGLRQQRRVPGDTGGGAGGEIRGPHPAVLCSGLASARYVLLRLTKPNNLDRPAPEERTLGKEGVFSETLAQALRENFEAGSQSLLLLNRRGYHTIISCASCNQPVYCPNCSIPMTYHKVNNSLMCHYCGHTQDMVETCPSCGGKHLRKMGFGTQRLEEELRLIVPEARILRMDADTTMSRYAYEERFQEFRQGKYDIMLGTQMIGKGLDFPNVTLVGVLSVDKALYAGDFRSYERTFSLITQVVGRGGRGEKAGRAILQTSMPEHYVLRLAAQQAYPAFYEQEIALRRQLIFPPICDICVVGFTGMREPDVRTAAMHTADVLKDQIRKTGFSYPIWVLEPVPCVYGRINGKYRYQLVIKCKNTKPYRDLIHAVLTEAGADRSFARVHLYADMNGDVGI